MNGADIQIDQGNYTRIHNAILDKLSTTDFTALELRTLIYVLRCTYGYNLKEAAISTVQLADHLGIERTNARRILRRLVDQNVLYQHGTAQGRGHFAVYGFNKYFEKWKAEKVSPTTPFSEPQKVSPKIPIKPVKGITELPQKVSPVTPSKDSKDKQQLAGGPDPFIEAWHRFVGRPVASPYEADRIIDWEARVTLEGWRAALEKVARKRPGNLWGYLETILNDYADNGYHAQAAPVTVETVLAYNLGDLL